MKVLVVGSGGREHALVKAISRSPLVEKIYAAPGNPGIARLAECVDINPESTVVLRQFARKHHIDLTVVGPEKPLALGIAQEFYSHGLDIFGPISDAARIEWSKGDCKALCERNGVPTAGYEIFDRLAAARNYASMKMAGGAPVVIKADGLAGGKGSFVCRTGAEAEWAIGQMMEQKIFGPAGEVALIEDFVAGPEYSMMVITDGGNVAPLIAARDYKAAWAKKENEPEPPNTGGMGSFAPVPDFSSAMQEMVLQKIIKPTLSALLREGRPYQGVLYAGLKGIGDDLKLIEFNCRFGDPETQAQLGLLETDIVEVMVTIAEGKAFTRTLQWSEGACACLALVAAGYPGVPKKGDLISGIEEAEKIPGVEVLHAGTALRSDGAIVTAGGRVLNVRAKAKSLAQAWDLVYQAAHLISWDGMWYREDLG